MKLFGKRRRLKDGYMLSLTDKGIRFYRDSPMNKGLSKNVRKFDEEKVLEFEGTCQKLFQSFMKSGYLRLHWPLHIHEEGMGAYFLYVPPKERPRVAGLLNGGILVSKNIEPDELPQSFAIRLPRVWLGLEAPNGQRILDDLGETTLKDLIGSGEVISLTGIAESNPEEARKIQEQTGPFREDGASTVYDKFFILTFNVQGMFIEREKTWLDNIGLRG